MAKPNEPYLYILVESYRPISTAGLHGDVHIRPVEGQGFAAELHVQCSKELSDIAKYPLGTVFRIQAKLNDRAGGGQFLYSSYKWPYDVVRLPSLAKG